MTTPSITVETDGSTPSEKLNVPIPRIESPCPRVLALLLKPIEGDTCDNCSRLLTRLSDSSDDDRSEEHTSELQSLMRISYAVFCLKKKKKQYTNHNIYNTLT